MNETKGEISAIQYNLHETSVGAVCMRLTCFSDLTF